MSSPVAIRLASYSHANRWDTPAGAEYPTAIGGVVNGGSALPSAYTTADVQADSASNWPQSWAAAPPYPEELDRHLPDEANRPAWRARTWAEAKMLSGIVWRDATQTYSTWRNLAWIGAAAGGALAIRESGWDDDVRAFTAEHPDRWGRANDVLSFLGEGSVHWPALAVLYVVSVRRDDPALIGLSQMLVSSMAITGISTTIVKLATNTERPTDTRSGGRYGFPSYHAATSFCVAAVIDEMYGSGWGLLAYTTAGMIGWSRLDEREHDLSDVVFGASLGFVIGKSVAGIHLHNDPRVRLLPFRNPYDGATGVAAHLQF